MFQQAKQKYELIKRTKNVSKNRDFLIKNDDILVQFCSKTML